MLRRQNASPQYYQGRRGVNNEFNRREPGASTCNTTIAGNYVHIVGANGPTLSNLTFDYAFTMNRAVDRLRVFSIWLIAGADTVIESASVDGQPAFIACQANAAGFISAIVYGQVALQSGILGAPGTPNILRQACTIKTSGTAPTVAFGEHRTFMSVQGTNCLRQARTGVGGAAATTTTLTFGQTFRHDLFYGVGFHDINTQNQATITGTINNQSEGGDSDLSTGRRVTVGIQTFTWVNELAAPTSIITWDIGAAAGFSYVGAMFSGLISLPGDQGPV